MVGGGGGGGGGAALAGCQYELDIALHWIQIKVEITAGKESRRLLLKTVLISQKMS